MGLLSFFNSSSFPFLLFFFFSFSFSVSVFLFFFLLFGLDSLSKNPLRLFSLSSRNFFLLSLSPSLPSSLPRQGRLSVGWINIFAIFF